MRGRVFRLSQGLSLFQSSPLVAQAIYASIVFRTVIVLTVSYSCILQWHIFVLLKRFMRTTYNGQAVLNTFYCPDGTEGHSATPPLMEGGTVEPRDGLISAERVGGRMIRADRKRKVSPYVPRFIKEHVHDMSRYLRQSEGETGARLVIASLNDFPTLNRLAPYMWRDYAHGTHAWIGHLDHENLDALINPRGHVTEHLSMRFTQDDWASIDALGFAFGRPVAHAAAALLRFTYDYPCVTQMVAPGYVPRSPYSIQRGHNQWGSGRTS